MLNKVAFVCLLEIGEVTIAYPLKYEGASTSRSWILYFRACDDGPVPSKTGTVTATLQDAKDNSPQSTSNIYT